MIIANPLLPFSFPLVTFEENGPVSVTETTNKQFTQTKTVGGYVYSHWGEQPSTLDVRGSILLLPGKEMGGFLSLSILKQLYYLDKKKIDSILASMSKVTSSAQALYGIAIDSRYLYEQVRATSGGSSANLVASAGPAVSLAYALKQITQKIYNTKPEDLSWSYIFHDTTIYGGFFTNFTYTRDAAKPRQIDYNFKFLVEWNTDNMLADKLLATTNGNTITGLSGQ